MHKPLLKYCGIRSEADLKIVAESAADFIGFIFANSKRRVEPGKVKEWLKIVDASSKKLVAVFVNPSQAELHDVLSVLPIDVIQFHGNERIEDIKRAKEKFSGTIWKALHHHPETIDEMNDYKDVVDGYVIDSRMKNQWGGTGISFDWTAVPNYLELATTYEKVCFIAGGVNEQNIDRLLTLKPHGIDLSSGIEMNDKKSKKKIQLIEERMLQHVNIS